MKAGAVHKDFNRNKAFLLSIFGLFCLLTILLWPFFRSGFFETDDGNWMIIRLSAFYQSFREGQFPVRFLGRLNHSYGYPVANFLYPGFLYVGSFLHALQIPFVESVKVIFIGSVAIGGFAIFFVLLRKFSYVSSFLGSASFILSPYVAFDIYTRGSVGEILAIGTGAVILYAFFTEKKPLFTLATAFLLLSHNSTAVLFLIFFIFLILLKKQLSYFINIFFAVAMTTFFWFPAMYEQQYVLFNSIAVSNPKQYFTQIHSLYLLNVPVFVSLGLLFLQRKKVSQYIIYFSFIYIISNMLTFGIFQLFWNIPIIARLFQFPFRMLSLGVLTGPFIIAYAHHVLSKKQKIFVCLIYTILLTVPVFWLQKSIKRTFLPESYYSTNEATTTVSNEYMPIWSSGLPKERAPKELEFIKGKGTFAADVINTQKIIGTLHIEEDSVIQINKVYYPGWGAMIEDKTAEITYDNPKGLMQIAVPVGVFSFTAEFRETVPRFIASAISAFFTLVYLIIIVTFWMFSRARKKDVMHKKKDKMLGKKKR